MLNLTEEAKLSLDELMKVLAASHSAFHSTAALVKMLKAAGFNDYTASGITKIEPGMRGFITQNKSALMAFRIGEKPLENGFKIVGAHTDSPTLRIKPNPIIEREGCLLLNTEVYGGPILNTWFDRPLSLAGRIVYRKDGKLRDELIDLVDPLLILPNLAIHMNRKVNEGEPIIRQKMLLPVIALADSVEDFGRTVNNFGNVAGTDADVPASKQQNKLNKLKLIETICAAKLGCPSEDIIDYDLYVYDIQPPCVVGLNHELLSSPRLDNVAMSFAAVSSLIKSTSATATCVAFASDNEEVGSRSRQGAASMFCRDMLESLFLASGGDRLGFLNCLNNSFLISADQAHAVHPHYPEVADPVNHPRINHGPVIKLAANLSYATDAGSAAVFKELCRQAEAPFQYFVNHSDRPGGSTIGPISTAYLHCPTVDIGNAIWGMHSVRETGGVADTYILIKILRNFYSNNGII